MNRLDKIEETQLRRNIPEFQPGDTVRVHVRIKESETKERLQAFEGVVIARKHGGARETITVRKTSFGVGVERIFPLHATIIDHIDLVKRGRVRRAKLYYLRGLRGKAARIRERDTRGQQSDETQASPPRASNLLGQRIRREKPIADRHRCAFSRGEACGQRKLRHKPDRGAGPDRRRQRLHALRHDRRSSRSFPPTLAQFQSSHDPASHAVDRIPLTLSAELRKHPVDVLHVQFTAPPFCPCPAVVSIHDLSFEHLPQTFKRRSRTQLRLTVRHSARRAARILTLSEHTRSDIIETYGIIAEKGHCHSTRSAGHFGPVTTIRNFNVCDTITG